MQNPAEVGLVRGAQETDVSQGSLRSMVSGLTAGARVHDVPSKLWRYPIWSAAMHSDASAQLTAWAGPESGSAASPGVQLRGWAVPSWTPIEADAETTNPLVSANVRTKTLMPTVVGAPVML